ncbi:MAG: CHAT domain-containing tetratricopeptide repeat protein [Bacteroidota bacterium]
MKHQPLTHLAKFWLSLAFLVASYAASACQYDYVFKRAYSLHEADSFALAIPYYEVTIIEINNCFNPTEYTSNDQGMASNLIQAMTNLAICQIKLGQYELAEPQLRATLDVFSILKERNFINYKREARAHYRLGEVLEQKNDFVNAQVEYEIAITAAKNMFTKSDLYTDDLPDIYTDLSGMMLYFQQPKDVIRIAEEAMRDSFMFNYPEEIAMVYHNLGGAYLLEENYELADTFYRNADTLFRTEPELYEKEDLLRNHLFLLTDFGLLYGHMGKYQQALDSLSVAEDLAIRRSSILRIQLNDILAAIKSAQGLVYQLKEDFPQAITYYQQAITRNLKQTSFTEDTKSELAKQGAANSILLLSENVPELVEALLGIAQCHHATKRADSTDLYLGLAINTLKEANRDFFDAQTRLRMATISKAVHEAAIQFYEDSDPIRAYEYGSSGKYQVLYDDLIRRRILKEELQPEAFEEWLNKQEEYRQLRNSYLQDPSPSNLNNIQQIRRELMKLTAQADASKLSTNRNSRVQFRKLESELLEQDQHLLEYFMGQDRLYIFHAQKGDIAPELNTVMINRFELEDLIQQWREALMDDKALRELDQLSMELYRILIEPVAAKLKGEKILVIPDGKLALLPFGALFKELPIGLSIPYNGPRDNPYDKYDYLARSFQISYSYSLAMLEQAKISLAQSAKKPRKMLAILVEDRYRQQVDELPEKARRYVRHFPMTVAEREEGVNLLDTLRNASDLYRHLLLVTHGSAESHNPELATILLANGQDTLHLTLAELYALNLDFEMIVTSACQIGYGALNQGEGVISLARGFTQAGAQSLITSLWEIKGDINGYLIPLYYQGLSKGLSKDEALQYAMDGLFSSRPNWTHPRFWAGMIPIGNMDPIINPYGAILTGLLWLLIMLGVGYGSYRWWKRD